MEVAHELHNNLTQADGLLLGLFGDGNNDIPLVVSLHHVMKESGASIPEVNTLSPLLVEHPFCLYKHHGSFP